MASCFLHLICFVVCDDWYFGNNCSSRCNCLIKPCDKFTGRCPKGGCQTEWHGESCNQVRSKKVINWLAIGGGVAGLIVMVLILLGVCFIYKRKAISTEDRNQATNTEYIDATWDKEETELPSAKEHCVHSYNNIPTEDTSCNYKISIENLKQVTNEKQKDCGFQKEFESLPKELVHPSLEGSREENNVKNRFLTTLPYINHTTNTEYIDATWDQEETELSPAREHFVHYNNIPTEDTSCNYKISIENLKQVINEKQKDCGFKKEFESLPKELVHPSVEGSREENKVKNRFLTTLPYDHSRIVLKGNTDHDYINASYIDNYDKERAYIAAQGPKRNIVRDFWHMVWQENVRTIVMVTQLEEGRKEKCAKYWPESVNKPLVVDSYRLIMTEEKQHTHYMYRKITVLNSSSMDVRNVCQFQFTQWPDHGVPDSIKLVNFYRRVGEDCNRNGPMIVHCSAGVGRTGTFIAIDALYENGKKVGYVDVMDYLHMMRKDRMNMIKTYEQYETVFEALLELFTVPKMSISWTDFSQYINDIENMTLPFTQKMCEQFQTLETLRPSYPASKFTSAKLRENMSKNSVKNILPHDEFRPYLISYGRTRTDYINAVIIPGYRDDSIFLVTQCPIKDTIVDFWTMIYDHNSRIIVLLDPILESAQLWLERKEMMEFHDLSIIMEEESHLEELKIAMNHKTKQDKRVINVFTASEWQGAILPSSQTMLGLLKSVGNCRDSQKCPITVVCRNGCTKSGLFVALSLILDKLELDDEIDVFQAVRHIQSRRPEFLTNCDHYQYCYKCIKDLLKGQSVYTNTYI